MPHADRDDIDALKLQFVLNNHKKLSWFYH